MTVRDSVLAILVFAGLYAYLWAASAGAVPGASGAGIVLSVVLVIAIAQPHALERDSERGGA